MFIIQYFNNTVSDTVLSLPKNKMNHKSVRKLTYELIMNAL